MKFSGLLVFFLSAAPSIGFAEVDRSIAAVNAPLAYIARALGGPDLEVIYPIPKDVDPAFWAPSPEEVQLFQNADLILLNGAGYAGWVNTAILPRARLVDTTAAVQAQLIPADDAGVAHKHGPRGVVAHAGRYAFTTWLDPDIAQAQVDAVAGAITRRWPELADQVRGRVSALRAEVGAMDEAFKALSAELAERQVFASHPVYQYFARAYLGQVTSLHWEPDTLPSDRDWAAFRAMLDPDRSPVMIWEGAPILPIRERLTQFGVGVVVLSPMASTAETGRLFADIAEQIK